MKSVMGMLHQLNDPRTCPGKPAPLGLEFADLDLLDLPPTAHRPP